MKKGSDKRGLSQVVSALLIILLVIVLIVIVWVVVRNVLEKQGEGVFLEKVTINLDITKAKRINDTNINVTIKREIGRGEIYGVYFVVYDKNSSEVMKYPVSMKELQEKNFEISLYVLNASKAEKIAVAPIFQIDSGKEIIGEIKDEYIIGKGGSSGIINPGCTQDSECTDTNLCTVDRCSNGVCLHTPMICNDNNLCTNDLCSSGTCTSTPIICSLAHATSSCSSGSCVISSCNSGWGNCDGLTLDGCETNILTNISNCGSCGSVCSLTHATSVCSNGNCGILLCATGWRDCNSLTLDGCETNILTNISNCGSCGNNCLFQHVNPVCTNGVCSSSSCATGWGNCDGVTSNGCETNLLTNISNCGSCGSVCSLAHATSSCSNGNCGIVLCASGWGNCDGVTSNGCETPLNSVSNCGSCGSVCSLAHATSSCSSGSCVVSSCNSGWGNCNGLTLDGCETNILTNISNCGSCGNTCSLAHATSSCSNGNCVISSCNSGWGNCDGLTLDGCETNILTNISNCGSCGSVCSLTHATSVCSSGSCGILLCASGWRDCNSLTLDGCETNILTNISNCGSCGNSCLFQHVNPVCTNGVCSASSCATGWGNCDGVTSNGCETNILTNISNCGSCGSVCSLAHATSACSNGNCGIVLCVSGWGNCDGVTSNGCETPLNSVSNCGSCGNTCSLAHATSSCSSGSCVISSCATGWGNCNGLTLDGCETNILTNISNCGSCGNTCSTGYNCVSGACDGSPSVNYIRTFYVNATTGNDANSGTSPSTPWRTLSKVSGYAFQPGDGILFRKGDSWYGTLIINSSGNSTHPITYSSYGSGNKPIISGFTTVTGWTNEGGGIYSSIVPTQTSTEVVLVNGVQYELGRWPNEGSWNYFESHITNISILDNELPASPDWDGAEVVIRVNEWSFTRNIITNHTNRNITYTVPYNSGIGPFDNFGYFIQNDLRTLDKFGEWYYNNDTERLYIYFGSNNPTNYNVQISSIGDLISFGNYRDKRYITIDGLFLEGANKRGIYTGYNNDYAIIKNCEIEFVGNCGIIVYSSHNCLIENTNITNSNACGISSYGRNLSVRNCVINNTGLITGLGLTSSQSHLGMYTGPGGNHVIENNKIYNTGYSGINFAGNNSVIKNNLIDNYCISTNDGGGIYFGGQTSSFNMSVIGNIVLRGVGGPGGKPLSYPLSAANGIYIDYNTRNGVKIYNNTVEDCVGGGIFIHESPNIEVMDNTVYNCTQAMRFQDSKLGTGLYNIVLRRNIFFAKYPPQITLWAYSGSVGFDEWGNFNYNYYARPIEEGKTINAAVPTWGTNLMSLDKWSELYKQDNNSHISPRTIPYYIVNRYLSSNKFYNGDFATNISGGLACWNGLGNCVLSWDNTHLDGGALRITFNATTPPSDSLLTVPIGEITAGKNYILKYSVIANRNTTFDMNNYLRKHSSPYTRLTTQYYRPITTIRTENEILMPTTNTDTVSSIVFQIENTDSVDNVIWIDNIQLYDADITLTNINDYILFEYNPTKNNRVVSLPSGNYVDVTGRSYSGSVTLRPYTSIILIKS